MTIFQNKVKEIVFAIPKGETMTYGEVAESVGSPKAYCAVATVMAQNYDPMVPCHRVIRTDGTLGEYNRGGTRAKYKLLQDEGVKI